MDNHSKMLLQNSNPMYNMNYKMKQCGGGVGCSNQGGVSCNSFRLDGKVKKRAWACKHSDKLHYGKGLCSNCYHLAYYHKRRAALAAEADFAAEKFHKSLAPTQKIEIDVGKGADADAIVKKDQVFLIEQKVATAHDYSKRLNKEEQQEIEDILDTKEEIQNENNDDNDAKNIMHSIKVREGSVESQGPPSANK